MAAAHSSYGHLSTDSEDRPIQHENNQKLSDEKEDTFEIWRKENKTWDNHTIRISNGRKTTVE